MDEAEPVWMNATCHTEGCPADGITYRVQMYANEAPPTFRAQCGRCGQPVTDLVPA